MFLLCVHGTTVAPSTPSKVCTRIQCRKPACHGWLLDPSRTCEPRQALNLQRTPALLRGLLLQSGTHAILLPWGALLPWLSISWYSPGRRAYRLCPRLLPRWRSDSPFWRTDRPQRSGKSSPFLIPSTCSSPLVSTQRNLVFIYPTSDPCLSTIQHDPQLLRWLQTNEQDCN